MISPNDYEKYSETLNIVHRMAYVDFYSSHAAHSGNGKIYGIFKYDFRLK